LATPFGQHLLRSVGELGLAHEGSAWLQTLLTTHAVTFAVTVAATAAAAAADVPAV